MSPALSCSTSSSHSSDLASGLDFPFSLLVFGELISVILAVPCIIVAQVTLLVVLICFTIRTSIGLGRLLYAASACGLWPSPSLRPDDLPSKTSIGTLLHQGRWAEENSSSSETLD